MKPKFNSVAALGGVADVSKSKEKRQRYNQL